MEKTMTHIDISALKDCKNKAESFGEICVRCNKCGRFGKMEDIEAPEEVRQIAENEQFLTNIMRE